MRMKRSVRINAQGKELCKFINLMHEKRIDCREQYCSGNIFHGDILHRDLSAVREIAESCGVSLKTASYDTPGERLFRYRKRIGLFVGAILAAFTVVYFSQVIVTVEISGNSAVSTDVILAALAELDVKAGTPIHSIDLQKCADSLPFMVDGVAWAGVHRTGSRVAVQIRETVPAPQKAGGRLPCNIVSSHDAEITYVLARSGTSVHKAGDYVPKGTMLIRGVSQSESGRTVVCRAMGDIRGIYSETFSFSAAFSSEVNTPSGRTDTRRILRLFGLDIPLSIGGNKYEKSSVKYSEKHLVLFGKQLPISIRREDISETVSRKKVYTEKELTEMLMQRVYLCEKNFLGSDIRIISRKVTSEKTDDMLTLSISYRLEGSIVKQQEFFVK